MIFNSHFQIASVTLAFVSIKVRACESSLSPSLGPQVGIRSAFIRYVTRCFFTGRGAREEKKKKKRYVQTESKMVIRNATIILDFCTFALQLLVLDSIDKLNRVFISTNFSFFLSLFLRNRLLNCAFFSVFFPLITLMQQLFRRELIIN